MALPYLAGKSLTTKGTKYTKGERGYVRQTYFLRDLRVLCVENGFPIKNGRLLKLYLQIKAGS